MPEIRLLPQTLVVLCGPAGAGKSTFAIKHFLPTEIVSSDRCRELICDDAQNQEVNRQTFELFHHILKLRLSLGRLSVADSTALEGFARESLLQLAREARYHTCLFVFAFAEEVYQDWNSQRARMVPGEVLSRQVEQLNAALCEVRTESWNQIHIFKEWPQDLQMVKVSQ